jgi:hypothetical protein
MSSQSIFFKIFLVYMASLALMQAYFYFRIRKGRENEGKGVINKNDQHLTSKQTLLFGLFHTSFLLFVIAWVMYDIQSGKISTFLGIVFIVIGFMIERKPMSLVLKNRPRPIASSTRLALRPPRDRQVSPEFIQEILGGKELIDAIQKDLSRVGQIGGRERWRLGLIRPGHDQIDPSITHLPLTETAVLHGSTAYKLFSNNIQIRHSAEVPAIQRYQDVQSYSLSPKVAANDFIPIREVRVDVSANPSEGRNAPLSEFLREQGFPLKKSYQDGDPLTTERGGTIVIDRETVKIIYPDYLIQRRLIDDEGNLIHMGLDENFRRDSLWRGIALVPSVSEKLYKNVEYHGYIPIVRYRSFPCASEFMLPILDTPLSDSGWADLLIDPHGRAKLFIAREKTLEQWYAMMESLRQLFFHELARKGNRLLAFTKDEHHLDEYFRKKQAILDDYFITLTWSLPQSTAILSLSPSQV